MPVLSISSLHFQTAIQESASVSGMNLADCRDVSMRTVGRAPQLLTYFMLPKFWAQIVLNRDSICSLRSASANHGWVLAFYKDSLPRSWLPSCAHGPRSVHCAFRKHRLTFLLFHIEITNEKHWPSSPYTWLTTQHVMCRKTCDIKTLERMYLTCTVE